MKVDLNNEDYDQKAQELSSKIEQFVDAEQLKELLKLNGSGIEDVTTSQKELLILFAPAILRSIDESENEFIPAIHISNLLHILRKIYLVCDIGKPTVKSWQQCLS